VRATGRRWAVAIVAAGLGPGLASLGGCREELGPEPMPTATVTGRIHVAGEPIGGGWVEFHPVEGTVGLSRSAPLALDGTFRADKVPIGRVVIHLEQTKVEPTFKELLRRLPSPRREIQGPCVLDLDLAEEARRARARPPR
jgi:hypothetical protein